MTSSAHGKEGEFVRTRWSVVKRLAEPDPGAARDALAELAVRYWYPVYAYVRRCGHAPVIAQDITRSFLQQVGTDIRAGMEPVGRFRNWLLERLSIFLAGDWQDLATGDSHLVAPDVDVLERRQLDDHARDSSPEDVFRRSFAIEVLANGFKALHAEARQTGHLDMFDALEPFLVREPAPGQYEEIGQALGVRPLALVLAVKRLRQRLHELVLSELSETVASAEELDAERSALFAALREKG